MYLSQHQSKCHIILAVMFLLSFCAFQSRNYRISDLVTKRMISEDAMAWLNTLGGGYSALGDYFEHHVCCSS